MTVFDSEPRWPVGDRRGEKPGELAAAGPECPIEIIQAARSLIDQKRPVEPQITADLLEVCRATSGTLVGLDHRFKTEESLAEKLAGIIAASPSLEIKEAAEAITDVLRYTIAFEPNDYTSRVLQVLGQLTAAGYVLEDPKNYWREENCYRGINSVIVTKGGEVFELQFHTPESFYVKEHVLHPHYKVLQKLIAESGSADDADLDQLRGRMQVIRAKMKELSQDVVIPEGAASIGRLVADI